MEAAHEVDGRRSAVQEQLVAVHEERRRLDVHRDSVLTELNVSATFVSIAQEKDVELNTRGRGEYERGDGRLWVGRGAGLRGQR